MEGEVTSHASSSMIKVLCYEFRSSNWKKGQYEVDVIRSHLRMTRRKYFFADAKSRGDL